MTNIPVDLMRDQRFQRCLNTRKMGTINVSFEPPVNPSLEWWQAHLDKAILESFNHQDSGIDATVQYLQDFVSLLKEHSIHPGALELTLKEFEAPAGGAAKR